MNARAIRTLAGFGPVEVVNEPHSDDDDTRTAQTVGRMREHILDAAADPVIRNTAATLIRSAGGARASQAAIVDKVFDATQAAITFVDDPVDRELLIRPELMARLPAQLRRGDCDDFSMFAGALLEVAGVPWRIVTVKADQRDPSLWSHVYLQAFVDGEWLGLDASHGPEPGWEAPHHFGLRAWGGSGGRQGMNGLGDGFNWKQDLLTTGLQVGSDIGSAFATRIAAPAGTYIRQADGSVIARGSSGATAGAAFPSVGTGFQLDPWLVLGAFGLIAVLALKR